MKPYILIITLAFGLTNCQKESVDFVAAAQKSEAFMSAAKPSDHNEKFIPSTVDDVTVRLTPLMSRAQRVKLEHRSSPWEVTIAAFDEMLVPLTSKNRLAAAERYDLEVLINSAWPVIQRADDSQEKSKTAARYLTYLLENSSPIDLHLLTNLYQTAKPALTDGKAKEIETLILNQAVVLLDTSPASDIPTTRRELLEWQAHFAINNLANNSK